MTKAHVIAVSSGKGGVGKTNFSTNLAIQLSQQGHKVCLFDADINLSNVPILLGITPKYTLADLFEGKAINDIVLDGPDNLKIIAGASGVASFMKLNENQQKIIFESIKKLIRSYDYLILDTAAGADNQVLSFLHSAPYLILMITPEPTSITDAFALLKLLKKQKYQHKVLVMVNQVRDYKMAKNIFSRFSDAVEKFIALKASFIGYIVSDLYIQQSVLSQEAVTIKFPDAPSSQCFLRISKRLNQALIKLAENQLSLKNDSFIDYFQQIIEARPLYESDDSRLNDIVASISLLNDEERNVLFENLGKQYLNKEQLSIGRLSSNLPDSTKHQSKKLENVALRQSLKLASQL